jgi:hypothetical protein
MLKRRRINSAHPRLRTPKQVEAQSCSSAWPPQPGEPSLVSQPSAASPTRGGWAAGLRQAGSFSYRLIAGEIRRVKSSARERRTLDAGDFSPPRYPVRASRAVRTSAKRPAIQGDGHPPPTNVAIQRKALSASCRVVGRVLDAWEQAPRRVWLMADLFGFVEPAVGLEPTTC